MQGEKTIWEDKNRQKGFTLIEVIISIALITIIITATSSLFALATNSYKRYTDTWQVKHDVHTALKYIEKGLKEFNQEDIIFDSDKNIFQSKNCDNKNVFVNLSGKVPRKQDISLIYFNRPEKRVGVNKNGEYNTLANDIDDIKVNELIEGQLIEIEVVTDKIEYSNKIRLNLNYRKD